MNSGRVMYMNQTSRFKFYFCLNPYCFSCLESSERPLYYCIILQLYFSQFQLFFVSNKQFFHNPTNNQVCRRCAYTFNSSNGRQTQADLCEFKAILFYRVNSRQPWLDKETLSQKKKNCFLYIQQLFIALCMYGQRGWAHF